MTPLFRDCADVWRSCGTTDGLRNGDASSSSLAAKGFRSVRPNLQDKRSPTPVNHSRKALPERAVGQRGQGNTSCVWCCSDCE